MTVKELIEYLNKCNSEYEVRNAYGEPICNVLEYRNLTDPEDCYVEVT